MVKSSLAAKVVSLRSEPQANRMGVITGVNSEGLLLVDYEGNPFGPRVAASLVCFTPEQVSAAVMEKQSILLTFADDRPVVVGIVQHPAVKARAVVDDREVVLRGSERVELRCGKASIVLTKEGKIIVRGETISSHANGAHRIRGGSIELN